MSTLSKKQQAQLQKLTTSKKMASHNSQQQAAVLQTSFGKYQSPLYQSLQAQPGAAGLQPPGAVNHSNSSPGDTFFVPFAHNISQETMTKRENSGPHTRPEQVGHPSNLAPRHHLPVRLPQYYENYPGAHPQYQQLPQQMPPVHYQPLPPQEVMPMAAGQVSYQPIAPLERGASPLQSQQQQQDQNIIYPLPPPSSSIPQPFPGRHPGGHGQLAQPYSSSGYNSYNAYASGGQGAYASGAYTSGGGAYASGTAYTSAGAYSTAGNTQQMQASGMSDPLKDVIDDIKKLSESNMEQIKKNHTKLTGKKVFNPKHFEKYLTQKKQKLTDLQAKKEKELVQQVQDRPTINSYSKEIIGQQEKYVAIHSKQRLEQIKEQRKRKISEIKHLKDEQVFQEVREGKKNIVENLQKGQKRAQKLYGFGNLGHSQSPNRALSKFKLHFEQASTTERGTPNILQRPLTSSDQQAQTSRDTISQVGSAGGGVFSAMNIKLMTANQIKPANEGATPRGSSLNPTPMSQMSQFRPDHRFDFKTFNFNPSTTQSQGHFQKPAPLKTPVAKSQMMPTPTSVQPTQKSIRGTSISSRGGATADDVARSLQARQAKYQTKWKTQKEELIQKREQESESVCSFHPKTNHSSRRQISQEILNPLLPQDKPQPRPQASKAPKGHVDALVQRMSAYEDSKQAKRVVRAHSNLSKNCTFKPFIREYDVKKKEKQSQQLLDKQKKASMQRKKFLETAGPGKLSLFEDKQRTPSRNLGVQGYMTQRISSSAIRFKTAAQLEREKSKKKDKRQVSNKVLKTPEEAIIFDSRPMYSDRQKWWQKSYQK